MFKHCLFVTLITLVLAMNAGAATTSSSDDSTVEATYGFDFYVGQLADQTSSVQTVDNALSVMQGESPECTSTDLDDRVYGWCNSSRGAITNWAVEGGTLAGTARLAVLKETDSGYELVAQSNSETIAANTTNRFTTNIPLDPDMVYRFALIAGTAGPTEWLTDVASDALGRARPVPSEGDSLTTSSLRERTGMKLNLKVIVDRDSDADQVGNLNDSDDDNDGIADSIDNCRKIVNADQVDTDSDQTGDECDSVNDYSVTVPTTSTATTTPTDTTPTEIDPWTPTETVKVDPDPEPEPAPWCKRKRRVCDKSVLPSGPVKRSDDEDGDGTKDVDEQRDGASPVDVDSDDDGIGDQDERKKGADPTSRDTDHDGVSDGVEAGATKQLSGKRRYGISISGTDRQFFKADADSGKTKTLLTAEDTDHDGLSDGKEDRNRNGRFDKGETSPLSRDTDRDGISDDQDRSNARSAVKASMSSKRHTENLIAKIAATFKGTRGSDTLRGSAASDRLNGGFAPDSIYGYGGNDKLVGASGDDRLYGGGGSDYFSGGSGDDTIDTGSGANTVDAGDGDDQIQGGNGDDYLFGGRYGHERIEGGAGDDFIDAYRADDELDGGVGNDFMYGGPGRDYIAGDSGNDVINGGESNDYIEGGAGNDTLYGGFDSDSRSLDTLSGGAGNDTIYSFSSVKISCGSGTDRVYVVYLDAESEAEKESRSKARKAGSNIAIAATSPSSESTTDSAPDFQDIFGSVWNEQMQIAASTDSAALSSELDYSDDYGEGSQSYSTTASLASGRSKDCEEVRSITLSSKQAIDPFYSRRPSTVSRTDSAFVLEGSRGEITREFSRTSGSDDADNLVGTAKNDRVLAKRGKDLAFGGDGNDEIEGEEDSDEIGGGSGSDQLFGRKGDDLIYGDAGNDELWGSRGRDLLDGGDGNDTLYGGFQSDKLLGGAGDDRIVAVSGGKDTVNCGPGRHDVALVDKSDRVRGCEVVRR